ncbi:FAD-binding oxidoreductase [Corynebacterium variabile]|uniref:FAD/FMN-containing dehydrogenases n=6 Tax=Corynebacterium variabile TaxID=1727 RepID=A0A0X2NR46_9CORY|nr:FAD-linked oxidase C-terminal domain-containing protein [Corynebacterium variabile]MDN6476895.1 FAD-binding protein [Corynebacterium variabile]MDN6660700.1 FAD-binding protein [Corynebacterium variabile]MDN6676429.1 FAD-binding protein [Corynebacterium variabile]CUU67349.1 FAD/FMN-containing dehydrogenases [Corynebacterium variabile]
MSTVDTVDVADLDAELGSLLTGSLTTDPDILATFSRDESLYSPDGTPLALVRAHSVDDVVTTMRFAHAHGIPVVPQGARSGISGGANAVDGCILLSVKSMDRILAVDEENKTVTVEPGIINLDLKKALRSYGLAYPPDPGSVAMCSIGGNIATNAGGMCCVKYGVTREYVREITVVLADGTLTRLGHRTVKGVAGLDLAGLFTGSEGTLGVIVEATLKLVPLGPDPLSALATFPSVKAAVQTVAAYMATGATPSLLEMMDAKTIGMVNALGDFGLDESVGAVLIMQSDSTTAAADTEAFAAVATDNGAHDVAFADNAQDSEMLVAARRSAQPAWEHYAQAHGGGQLLDDVCIPRSAMAEFCDRVDAISDSTGAMVAVIAHAGDGNMHPSVFFDTADGASVARAQDAFDQIMALGLELGGTITGEHGVGNLKSEWLARELDEGNRRLHRSLKDAVDPTGILNPGKMLEHL